MTTKPRPPRSALAGPTLLTFDEAAGVLRRSRRWLVESHRALDIPSYHVGRTVLFNQQELIDWLGQHRQGRVKAGT